MSQETTGSLNPLLEYRLTNYEYVRIMSTRAHHLSNGAPTTLTPKEADGLTDTFDIAKRELELHKLPLKIQRTGAQGTKRIYTLDELVGRVTN